MRRIGELATRHVRSPVLLSCWIAGLMLAGSAVAFFLMWRGVAGTLAVPLQLPYLVSGGLGGLGLLVVSVTILIVQIGRRQRAREYRRLGDVLSEARGVLDALES